MVQLIVHICDLDGPNKNKRFESFELPRDSTIRTVKEAIAAVEGAPPVEKQELVFMEERLVDDNKLEDYGIDYFVKQVGGFVVNPAQPGKKFIDGVLVPWDTPEPDYDKYDV
mmetsp:Transcript_38501/g.46497  ORF Transcript_38501/g.46497 Transcript_38501/m.46497 type:complete len:112 (+) Transcript_38501:120-455(+)|eukprot:CAMPEP_0197851732 /NCGR_PEP_ID=MMETSP1438-20131217/18724_1 /TAXON_ID=1461541 /ORGANISM="Pterosperma sp., Strain CCMP1384" /LENGTH=111 /DNA_ID=CAMNT_0043465449 /DNA_START=113 /DNA_END=448 /DNA_ORIENTATION=+